MKIQVLEYGQSATDSPKHSISSSKAKRLVHELRWAVQLSNRVIQIAIAKSWSAIKTCLAMSDEKLQARQDRDDQMRAMVIYPDGAEFNFSRWPSADQRTVGI